MEKFKLYLVEQINILEQKLEELKKAIDALPSETNFTLEEYGDIKELKKEYLLKSKTSFVKRLLPVSKKNLISYARNNELSKLLSEKALLEQVIYELKEATNSIKDGKIQKELLRSTELIKELFTYSELANLSSTEFSRMLVIILKHTQRDEHVTSRIMQNISSFYDEEGTLLNKDNFGTLKLLFSKLFMIILTPEEQEKKLIRINEILSDLRIEHTLPEDQVLRETLLKERASLQALHEFIKDGRVVKSSSTIEEFTALLTTANVERSIADNLVSQMQQRIIKEHKIAEELRKQKIIQKYLTEEEIVYIKKAIELEDKTSGNLQSLISRTKNDVISLCKYLDFVIDTDGYQAGIEILSRRIEILKELITNLEKNEEEKNVFYYLADEDQIPYILRMIEALDIIAYPEIYSLLYALANHTKKGKIKKVVGGINIYEIEDKNYKIEYTLTSSGIIIINAHSKTLITEIPTINNAALNRLKKLMTSPKTKDVQQLHYQYESMILKELNLDAVDQTLSLLKKER